MPSPRSKMPAKKKRAKSARVTKPKSAATRRARVAAARAKKIRSPGQGLISAAKVARSSAAKLDGLLGFLPALVQADLRRSLARHGMTARLSQRIADELRDLMH